MVQTHPVSTTLAKLFRLTKCPGACALGVACAAALSLFVPGSVAAQEEVQLQPRALQQIQLLMAEKDARTQWVAGVPALLALVDSGQAARAESVGAVLDRELPTVSPLRAEMLAWWALAAESEVVDGPLTR